MVGPTDSPSNDPVNWAKERDEKDWYRDTDVTPDLKTTRNRSYGVLSPVLGGVGESWTPKSCRLRCLEGGSAMGYRKTRSTLTPGVSPTIKSK